MVLEALLSLAINVRSVSYTVPAFLADSTQALTGAGCGAGIEAELNPVTVKLYYARAYWDPNWEPIYLREHVDLAPGSRDTFDLDDSVPATYWVEPNNMAGPGCRTGITVGVPAVSVGWQPKPGDRLEIYDVRGRHLKGPPESPGLYFVQTWRAGKMIHVECEGCAVRPRSTTTPLSSLASSRRISATSRACCSR